MVKANPNHDRFLNRELSWLEFNARVLDEAQQASTPLLERLKFLAIFTSNQDEFYMVRVAGLKKMLKEGFIHCESPDQKPIRDVLKSVHHRSKQLIQHQYECFHQDIVPSLAEEGIKILNFEDLDNKQKAMMATYFNEEVFPVLTPLAVDPSHPYPFLANLSLYLLIEFYPTKNLSIRSDKLIGFVEIPTVIPRLIPIGRSEHEYHFILLESLVKAHLSKLFLGFDIKDCGMVRVTRNLDYTLLESRVVDLLESIQREVINRVQLEAVRLEADEGLSTTTIDSLKKILHLGKNDVFRMPGPMYLPGLSYLYALPFPHLKHPPFNPRLPARMAGNLNIFALIREKDLLVHHPYESFYTITEFLNVAASDPDVYAIKQTLYRSSGDSPIIDALIKGAENGKQVTAVVELKARFDEKNNIVWARRLERAGVHVVYGFVGLKTHCKTTLIVRKENNKLTRYVHLSTGNYNSQTAKQYTDLGLLTADEKIGEDISALFNLLTGFNILKEKGKIISPEAIPTFHKVVVSPLFLRARLLSEIDQVIAGHKVTKNGLIMAKVNGLDDRHIIEKLYVASQAGVKIKLIIRGICALRPGLKPISENIEVISIIDRFLEHSRIYYFHSGEEDRVFLSSADWLARNMDRRIELMYPIKDVELKERLIHEVLGTYWSDNTKARNLAADGSYSLKNTKRNEVKIRAQKRFIDLVREEGIKSIPYDKAMRYAPKHKGSRPVASSASWRKKKT